MRSFARRQRARVRRFPQRRQGVARRRRLRPFRAEGAFSKRITLMHSLPVTDAAAAAQPDEAAALATVRAAQARQSRAQRGSPGASRQHESGGPGCLGQNVSRVMPTSMAFGMPMPMAALRPCPCPWPRAMTIQRGVQSFPLVACQMARVFAWFHSVLRGCLVAGLVEFSNPLAP